MGELISTKETAERLGISISRVQAMIRDARLPAHRMGRDWFIREEDLALVSDRKPGRPKKTEGEGETKPVIDAEPEIFRPLTHQERLQAEIQAHQDALAFKPIVAAEMKADDVVKTPAKSKAKSAQAEAIEATRKSAPVKAKPAAKKRGKS